MGSIPATQGKLMVFHKIPYFQLQPLQERIIPAKVMQDSLKKQGKAGRRGRRGVWEGGMGLSVAF